MNEIPARRLRSFAWAAASSLCVAAALLTFCYPLWKVAIGGHFDLEVPGFDPIWKADRTYTCEGLLWGEIAAAVLFGAGVYAFSHQRSPDPRSPIQD